MSDFTRASVQAKRFVSRQMRAVGGATLIGVSASLGSLVLCAAGIALLLPAVLDATSSGIRVRRSLFP